MRGSESTDPKASATSQGKPAPNEWTFLTNHAHVLLCLTQEPERLMREVAELVGITERAVQRIISDLEQAGYLERIRQGRCNRYEVCADLPMRHPLEQHRQISALLDIVLRDDGD